MTIPAGVTRLGGVFLLIGAAAVAYAGHYDHAVELFGLGVAALGLGQRAATITALLTKLAAAAEKP